MADREAQMIRNSLWSWLAYLAIAGAAHAGPIEDLRAAITAGDISATEAVLGKAQQDFVDGRSDADEIRDLYDIFDTNNPETLAFALRWQGWSSDSPHAAIALAMTLERRPVITCSTAPIG